MGFLSRVRERRKTARPANPHAWKLGLECLLRGSDGQWEPMLVVGVSHKGALLLRDARVTAGKAFWVSKERAADRDLVSFDLTRE